MSGRITKAFKWGVSALRVAKARIAAGDSMKLTSGKPFYLGKDVRIVLGKGATLTIGSGVYLSPGCVVEVGDGASLTLENGVYMNERCRVTAVESVHVGAGTLFGPNVQIYDHDHEFDYEGVHSGLCHTSTSIGRRCWLCANVVVTRGCMIADCSLVSANSVVTRNLTEEGALYAGAPARLIKKYNR